MAKTHREFTEALIKSQKAVLVVADHLKHKGFKVRVPEVKIAPDTKSRYKYTDGGDIIVNGKRHEVKNSPHDFKSIEELEKRFNAIIVDEAYKLEKKDIGDWEAYWYVNSSLTGAVLIPEWESKNFFKQTLYDRKCRERREFYRILTRRLAYIDFTKE